MNYWTLNLPYNSKFLIWRNKYTTNIWILIKGKNFKITLTKKNKFYVNKWANTLIFKKTSNSLFGVKNFNKVNQLLNSINKYFYKKIKFKGKGFRIKFFKKIKLIKFYFGKSHKTFLLLRTIKRKKINKYKFILKSLKNQKLKKICNVITKIKNINFYTLRGLRISRQIIYKRKGKKGTYI